MNKPKKRKMLANKEKMEVLDKLDEGIRPTEIVKILESCYKNRQPGLGLAGNFNGIISKMLWSQRNEPLTLMDDTARLVENGPVSPASRHKLQLFVVSVSSSMNLTRTLQQIKASIWWNHTAAFLMLDWPLSNDGCSKVFEMLWAAWEMNILNAKLWCYHQAKGRLIYTYNPYTTQAPGTWQIDKTYCGKNDHPWTLFVRGYGDGDSQVLHNCLPTNASWLVTQYRGYKSQLSKIVSVVDSNSRIGLCLVCLANILFFKYFLRRPAMVEWLNTFLIICNSALPNIPRNLAPRVIRVSD